VKALLNSAVLVLDLASSEGTIDARHKDIVAQARGCFEELHAIVLCPEVRDSLGGELGRIGVSSVTPIICPEAALTTSALLPSLESAYRSLNLAGAPIFFATRFLDRECAASLAVILGGCAIAEAVATSAAAVTMPVAGEIDCPLREELLSRISPVRLS